MKNRIGTVAVAIDKGKISDHFGLCEHFLLFKTDGETIGEPVEKANPGHRPCELPELVAEWGANTIIVGNMGKSAGQNSTEAGLNVIIGAKGDATEAVQALLKGELNSEGDYCDAWMCEFFYHECG
ncbi:MAG: dinitrogenase iron-molybdenum cofactor [Spirochaetales bacterium]|nr:dinitrogenase iron-molybdenum cofactor [Spirochaetales bacterium]